jgi:hypothetical protein
MKLRYKSIQIFLTETDESIYEFNTTCYGRSLWAVQTVCYSLQGEPLLIDIQITWRSRAKYERLLINKDRKLKPFWNVISWNPEAFIRHYIYRQCRGTLTPYSACWKMCTEAGTRTGVREIGFCTMSVPTPPAWISGWRGRSCFTHPLYSTDLVPCTMALDEHFMWPRLKENQGKLGGGQTSGVSNNWLQGMVETGGIIAGLTTYKSKDYFVGHYTGQKMFLVKQK